MSRHATAENAEAIRNLTDRALAHLIRARGELRDALHLARGDFEDNAKTIEEIAGAMSLLTSALVVENSMWNTWAKARANA